MKLYMEAVQVVYMYSREHVCLYHVSRTHICDKMSSLFLDQFLHTPGISVGCIRRCCVSCRWVM